MTEMKMACTYCGGFGVATGCGGDSGYDGPCHSGPYEFAPKKAVVIGRHAGEIPGYEIVETRNVVWPATSQECILAVVALLEEVKALGWPAIILQNVPGQLAAALILMQSHESGEEGDGSHFWSSGSPIFVVVSKPAQAGEAKTFITCLDDCHDTMPSISRDFLAFVAEFMPGANVVNEGRIFYRHGPNHKPGDPPVRTGGLKITVEPQRRFEFSHLERLL